MHPILEHTERLRLYLAAWLLIAALLAGLASLKGNVGYGYALVLSLPMALVYAFVCLSSLHFCRAFPLRKNGLIRPAMGSVVAAGFSSMVWILAGRGLVAVLATFEGFRPLEAWYAGELPLLAGTGVLLFLVALVGHYLMIEFDNARAIENQSLELERMAREAELRALKAQINPHFLFNSLNSISALTTGDAGAAREMCLHLADFYRSTLRLGRLQEISLREELALVEAFLAIEHQRFGTRLQFTKEIAQGAEVCLVPPLFLQPLIENAVNHGIAHMLEGGTISLRIAQHGRQLDICIENPVDPAEMPKTGNGFGLHNVRSRLRMFYGPEARMDIGQDAGKCSVRILIPMRSSETYGHPNRT